MYGGINLEKEKIMKSINFIKLLSVLLCIVMLLAACGPKEKETETTANTEKENASETETVSESTTEAETEEPTMAPVDPVIENFFKIEYEDGLTDIDPETVNLGAAPIQANQSEKKERMILVGIIVLLLLGVLVLGGYLVHKGN